MAEDIDLSHARPAADVHSTHVERELARISAADPEGMRRARRAAYGGATHMQPFSATKLLPETGRPLMRVIAGSGN